MNEKKFNKINFNDTPLAKGEYEECTFTYCDFSTTDLLDIQFFNCEFIGCNFSLAKLTNTAFSDATFKDSKLFGLRFDQCAPFGLSFKFDNCALNHSSFYKISLKKTVFKTSKLIDVDFTECDLSGSVFEDCDLTQATFEKTNIEKVDFRTSYNYTINLDRNKAKKARFSQSGLPGLLTQYDIDITL
jgi:uncharacterized protein YjbI with pentapeptide repeats